MPDQTLFSDDELMQRLQSGDELAFTEIYNKYWNKLLAIGYYHTHDKQAAEDIVHEVMLSLWKRKAEIRIECLEAYLATAVKFAVLKAIARDRRRRDLLAGYGKDDQFPDIELNLDARLLQESLRLAIDQLPEKARLVFTYSRMEDLSIVQIAGKMDLSPKAVEYHMTKALRTLRSTLKKFKSFFI
jgi:RNA polymerase sigma-70 factor (ECF subfamily)